MPTARTPLIAGAALALVGGLLAAGCAGSKQSGNRVIPEGEIPVTIKGPQLGESPGVIVEGSNGQFEISLSDGEIVYVGDIDERGEFETETERGPRQTFDGRITGNRLEGTITYADGTSERVTATLPAAVGSGTTGAASTTETEPTTSDEVPVEEFALVLSGPNLRPGPSPPPGGRVKSNLTLQRQGGGIAIFRPNGDVLYSGTIRPNGTFEASLQSSDIGHTLTGRIEGNRLEGEIHYLDGSTVQVTGTLSGAP